MKNFAVVLLLSIFVFACKNQALDLYVSATGDDAWSGLLAEANADSSDGPFASLERARSEIRKLSGLPAEGVTVYIRGGAYSRDVAFELTASDSGSAMRKSARLHEKLAGHKPRGPFKHFWGWDSRLVGKDQPFSLFLASGIPFEVVEELPADGWVFLSDEDARGVAEGRTAARSRNLLVRHRANVSGKYFVPMEENLQDIFALKHRIIPELKGVPYVHGENPAVFAWYPTARAALLWNVGEAKQTFQVVRDGQTLRTLALDGLDVALVDGL